MAENSNGQYQLAKEVFIGAGESGWKGEHLATDPQGRAKGALRKFIELVEAGTIEKGSILLIDSYDRLSRLPVPQSLSLFTQLITSGIGLVFTGSHDKRVIDEKLLENEPHTLYFIIGETIRSFTESQEKSRKIKAAKNTARELIQHGTKIPNNNLPKYITFNKHSKQYEEVPERAEIIRELVRGVLNGQSLFSLAGKLNRKKVKPLGHGREWRGTYIGQVLRNPNLIGDFLGAKDCWKPIVTREDFQAIQIILRQNRFNRGIKGELINVFRGVFFCAECGSPISCTTQRKINKRYFRCSRIENTPNSVCTNKHYLNADEVEDAFFYDFLNKPPNELLDTAGKKELESLQIQAALTRKKLFQMEAQYGEALEELGDLKAKQVREKLLQLESRKDEKKVELDELLLKVSRIQNVPQDTRKILLSFFDGPDHEKPTSVVYADTFDKMQQELKVNSIRERTRVTLPNLISRISMDSKKRQFFVYNHIEKLIYTSRVFQFRRRPTKAQMKALAEQRVNEAKYTLEFEVWEKQRAAQSLKDLED